jgi:hypothetical protein
MRVDEALAVLERAIADCLSTPLWARSSEQVVGYLDRLQVLEQGLAAVKLAMLREVDARGVAQLQGAPSLVSWLKDRHRVAGGAAKRWVALARALDCDLPATSQALAEGAVNMDQAPIIAAAVARVPAVVRADAEARLVVDAASFGPRELGRLAERILDHVAPDLARQQTEDELVRAEREAHEARRLYLVDVPGTCRVRIHGQLDREGAAHLRAALDPLSAPCPGSESDLRPPEQRRADGLVEICRRVLAAKALPKSGGDRPQIVITMDYDRLRAGIAAGTLDDGGLVSPDTVRRMACDAGTIPATLKGTGEVLDVGRERRLFSGHLRRALVVRDRGCAFPACDRPPRWCDGHHVKHWIDGGRTALSNAVLLCGHHHRLVHRGDWQVRVVGGIPEFIPPSYVDPTRSPVRNRYHRRP